MDSKDLKKPMKFPEATTALAGYSMHWVMSEPDLPRTSKSPFDNMLRDIKTSVLDQVEEDPKN